MFWTHLLPPPLPAVAYKKHTQLSAWKSYKVLGPGKVQIRPTTTKVSNNAPLCWDVAHYLYEITERSCLCGQGTSVFFPWVKWSELHQFSPTFADGTGELCSHWQPAQNAYTFFNFFVWFSFAFFSFVVYKYAVKQVWKKIQDFFFVSREMPLICFCALVGIDPLQLFPELVQCFCSYLAWLDNTRHDIL